MGGEIKTLYGAATAAYKRIESKYNVLIIVMC